MCVEVLENMLRYALEDLNRWKDIQDNALVSECCGINLVGFGIDRDWVITLLLTLYRVCRKRCMGRRYLASQCLLMT